MTLKKIKKDSRVRVTKSFKPTWHYDPDNKVWFTASTETLAGFQGRVIRRVAPGFGSFPRPGMWVVKLDNSIKHIGVEDENLEAL